MRVLFYGESPVVSTGLAQVTRTIVDALQDDHEVMIVGTNHHGIESYDKKEYPYNILPLLDDKDPYAIDSIIHYITEVEYDVLFVSTDFGRDEFIYETLVKNNLNKIVIGYYAIDCDILTASTFNSLEHCNIKLTYTQHGKNVIEKYRPDMNGLISAIPLACEPDVFYPLSEDERKQARKDLFYVEDDTFIVINVNRNQPRKDLGRTLQIFHEFHQKYPNSKLYMHAQQNDIAGHLPTMATMIGMELGKEVLFTSENFHVLQGFTREYLNKVYNAADCLMSTSLGEGWGLSTTEAMSAECPVIVPNNTAFTEIVGTNEERGFLVKSGGDIDHELWLYKMTNHPHSIVHSDDFIRALEEVYYLRDYAKDKAIAARKWTLEHTKQSIGKIWKDLFKQIEQTLEVSV